MNTSRPLAGNCAVAGLPRGTMPEGERVYAVGDIHGRLDLLNDIQREIAADLAANPAQHSVEVFLGDYVDRGPQSRQVVERLASPDCIADQRVCLMGNHEQMLLEAYSDPGAVEAWLMNGGIDTMRSYGAGARAAPMTGRSVQMAFRSAFPAEHHDFLAGLPRMAVFGGYIFVHAGLRPGRPLVEQAADDLVWIREPFLSSTADFGAIVIHGHTPVSAPEIRPNRINIDTGAVFTGCLTCIVLEGQERRFLRALR